MIQAVNQPIAYLYCITNLLDGMQYIGVSTEPERRFRMHYVKSNRTNSYIKSAIRKHGAESFKMTILMQGKKDYCYEMERKAVESYSTKVPNGYNICDGGRGFNGVKGKDHPLTGIPLSEEHRLKISKALKGHKNTPEQIARMKSKLTGRKLSQEAKDKLKESSKKVVRTAEWRANISKGLTGKKWDESRKQRFVQSRLGKVNSQESIEKQATSLKNKWADPEFRKYMMDARVAAKERKKALL